MLNEKDEELIPKCVEIICQEKRASTTLFQSRLKVGYVRADRLFSALVERGFILHVGDEYRVPETLPDTSAPAPAPVEAVVEPLAAPVAEVPAPAPAPAPAPKPQSVSITPTAKPTNPIDQITDVVLYRGGDGFVALVIGKGIVVRGNLTFEEWREAHYGLHKFRQVANIGLADSVNYARAKFGDDLVNEALQQMEFPFIEAKKAEAILHIPWQAREFELEEEHFFAAGGADLKPEETAKWLEIAVEEKLTPLELKRSIEVGKVIHTEDTQAGKGKNSGIVTIYAVRALYLQWKRNNYKALLEADVTAHKEVLTELEPLCELIDKLRASIAKDESK